MNNSVRRLSINANQPECQTQKNSQGLAAVMNRSRIWQKITVFIFDNRTSTFSEYAQIHQTLSKYIYQTLFLCVCLWICHIIWRKGGVGCFIHFVCKRDCSVNKTHFGRGGGDIYIIWAPPHLCCMQTLVNTVGTSNPLLCIKIRMNWSFHRWAVGGTTSHTSWSGGLLVVGCPRFWKSDPPWGELGCP